MLTSPRTQNIALTLLRVIAGLMFVQHGLQKLFGALGGAMPGGGAIAFGTEPWIAGVIELIAGLLIAAGLFTRVAAFIASGEMAVAYFQVHAANGFFPVQNRGELSVLYCFVFLFFAAFGGGRYSIDAQMRGARNGVPSDVAGSFGDEEAVAPKARRVGGIR
jgi:putative oxidoreductase